MRGARSAPVIILGAGPAGLTAAYELARNGVRSIVLEQDKPQSVESEARLRVLRRWRYLERRDPPGA